MNAKFDKQVLADWWGGAILKLGTNKRNINQPNPQIKALCLPLLIWRSTRLQRKTCLIHVSEIALSLMPKFLYLLKHEGTHHKSSIVS